MAFPLYFYINFVFIVVWIIYNQRARQHRALMLLGYLMLFNLGVELLAYLYSYYTRTPNHWIYNIYTTLQVLFLCFLYRNKLLQGALLKKKFMPLPSRTPLPLPST